MKYDNSRAWALLKGTPMAIRQEKLDAIIEFMRLRAEGVELDYKAAQPPVTKRIQSVAVMNLFGIIAQRMNLIMEFSGGCSTELFTRDFRQMVADPDVGAIILNEDTPGGGVFGTPELAQEIFNARRIKKVVTVANSLSASAGYWIGAAASEFVVTPGGEVGSIGVFQVHEDWSEANTEMGVKVTYISAGRLKTAGNPDEPLQDEARKYLQAGVDRYYDMFIAAVAKYRGVKIETVRSGFGEGGVVGAEEAVKMGMADRVGTLDDTIVRVLREMKTKTNGNGALDHSPDKAAAGEVEEPAAWLPPIEAEEDMPPPPQADQGDEFRRKRMNYA